MLSSALSYSTFVALALVGPGLALLRLLRLPVDPALVLPLGTVLAAASFWLSLVLGAPWLFPTVSLALSASLLVRRDPWERAEGTPVRSPALAFVALVALFAFTQYPWNRIDRDGSFVLDPIAPYDDAVFHVGLARELATSYPPQVPGLSGFRLGYHLGAGLVRGALLRWAGVEPYDAIARYDPTLWALALTLALASVARQVGSPPIAVALAPWTLLFTDFSFVFAGNPAAFYWTDLLRGNLLFSLAYVNPVVPGLALALGSLIALSRYQRGEARGWLAVAALLAAGVPHFKVFLGVHLLLGLAAAFLFGRGRRSVRPLLALAVPCAVSTAVLALGPGRDSVAIGLAPLDLVYATRESLGLPALGGGSLLLWAIFWLIASLGLRVLGLGPAVRALASGSSAAAALAAMALAAWPIGLLFRIAVRDAFPGQKVVNDALYVIEQGGPVLWVFTVVAIAGVATRRGRLLAAGLVCLALPSTLQFALQKARSSPDRVPPPMVKVALALRAVARPGDVVLQRPGGRYPPLPVLLANLRVPYERYTPFRTQFGSREELDRRHETVYRFFRTTDPAEALGIARALGASYLALYGADRIRFDPAGVLEPIHEQEGARAYRILIPPGPRPDAAPASPADPSPPR